MNRDLPDKNLNLQLLIVPKEAQSPPLLLQFLPLRQNPRDKNCSN